MEFGHWSTGIELSKTRCVMDENTRSDVYPVLALFYLRVNTNFKGCSLVSNRLNKVKCNEKQLNEIFNPLSDTVRTDRL
jgi:hypothetical protein